MRNRVAIIALIKKSVYSHDSIYVLIGSRLEIPGLPFGFVLRLFAERIFNWFTDITEYIPTICGSESAWTLSALDVPPLGPEEVMRDQALLLKALPEFVWCYIKNIWRDF